MPTLSVIIPNYTRADLIDMTKHYNAKTRDLLKGSE